MDSLIRQGGFLYRNIHFQFFFFFNKTAGTKKLILFCWYVLFKFAQPDPFLRAFQVLNSEF